MEGDTGGNWLSKWQTLIPKYGLFLLDVNNFLWRHRFEISELMPDVGYRDRGNDEFLWYALKKWEIDRHVCTCYTYTRNIYTADLQKHTDTSEE